MRSSSTAAILILTGILCCGSVSINIKPITAAQKDSLITFEVDDYPVTNSMLADTIHLHPKKSGSIISYGTPWYINISLQ